MILWINGAFGSGKTQAAAELARRLPGSFVYDPELIGFFLRKMTPKAQHTADFQDDPLWIAWNRTLLHRIAQSHPGVVLVPMTLTNPEYYRALIGSLRKSGITVRHVVLSASERTLCRRLHKRLDFTSNDWGIRHIPVCLAAFRNPLFENKIRTDGRTVPEVAEAVAQRFGLSLTPRACPLCQPFLELVAQLRVIR